MNVRYKIAVVGAGMIANAGHIPAWKNLTDRAQDTAERHGIGKSFDNLEDMLNGTSPDIVSVKSR